MRHFTSPENTPILMAELLFKKWLSPFISPGLIYGGSRYNLLPDEGGERFQEDWTNLI